MISLIRAELRKLFTVRSTYVILAMLVALLTLFAGFIGGYKASPDDLKNPGLLAAGVIAAVTNTAVLVALVGLLLMAHEYRYNTIMYTLTAAKSRSRVLLAKIIAVTIFVIPVILAVGTLSPLFSLAGIHLRGTHLVHQSLNYVDLLWRITAFGWGYAMFALIFVVLIRSQVGAIVTFFIVPSTVENILALVLKDNVKYLPFSSLVNIVSTEPIKGVSPLSSLYVAGAWLLTLWIIAWVTFLRRDAN